MLGQEEGLCSLLLFFLRQEALMVMVLQRRQNFLVQEEVISGLALHSKIIGILCLPQADIFKLNFRFRIFISEICPSSVFILYHHCDRHKFNSLISNLNFHTRVLPSVEGLSGERSESCWETEGTLKWDSLGRSLNAIENLGGSWRGRRNKRSVLC